LNQNTDSLLSDHAVEAHNSVLFFLINRHTLLVILNVYNGRLELLGRYLAVEQDVGFTVRAVLKLRKEKVGHHPADASGTSPEVNALVCEIPSAVGG
jgi:hypothetical protein